MQQSIIDKKAGTLYIADDLIIDNKTTLAALEAYFGPERLEVERGWKTYENGTLYDLKIKDWYFTMTFYYDAGKLTHITFYPRDEEVNNSSWDNFDPVAESEYYTKWMAAQLGDKSNFKWNLNQAGRHYSFSYHWGAAGVYYDFKGGTFSCNMSFKP